MAENNNLVLKKISDLSNLNFFIPSFQRGYRWDIIQVEDLLNDIKEYIDMENKESFLCLQPIVVYEKDRKYVVIDGQQRLTTIAIIKYYLFKQLDYNIEYEKYGKSLSCLLKPYDEENLSSNIHDKVKDILGKNTHSLDEYHIILSYLTIARYFNELELKDKYIKDFKKLFTSIDDNNSIQFIWYNVTDEINNDEKKAIEIFTRLNIGKIPLTDAELIKALFLKKDNFKESEMDKKLHIAYKWDEIEKTLNNDTFWYFISNKNENEIEKRNRIELILELAIGIKNGKNHKLFKEYENKLKENNKFDELWQQIEECFMTLKEWYNDNELYHYIGFLLCFKEYNIYTIYSKIKNLSKIDQLDNVIKKITALIPYNKNDIKLQNTEDYTPKYIEDYYKENEDNNYFLNLHYNENDKEFRKILLFIDVYNYINLNKNNRGYDKSNCFFINRYPFDIFKYEKKQSWSLEHIASQKNYDIEDRIEHIKKIAHELKDINIMIYEQFKDKINICINNDIDSDNNISIEDEKWEEILSIINNLNNGDINSTDDSNDLEIYKHTICNIALLQKDLNSQLNNNPFMIKRKMLLDISNRFIPNNTINAFSKKFNQNADTLIYWKKSDMLSYGCYILNTLSKFYSSWNGNNTNNEKNAKHNNNQGELR